MKQPPDCGAGEIFEKDETEAKSPEPHVPGFVVVVDQKRPSFQFTTAFPAQPSTSILCMTICLTASRAGFRYFR